MNEIKVVFSPKLDIDPAEFIAVWNDTPECREIAEAQLSQQTRTQFADVSLLAIILSFAGGIFTNIVSSRLDEFIKNKFTDKQAFKYKEIRQEDGSIIIKILPKKDDSPPSE
jgi:hypothetical protein